MMTSLKRLLLGVSLLAAGAMTFVLLGAPSFTDEPPPPAGGANNSASTTTIFGSDTLKTEPVKALGASQIGFSISATTGKDSAIVVLVSQDNTHYFTAALDGATANIVKSGYASGDSLSNGPHTFVLTYIDSKGRIQWPYRYVKLKIYGTVGAMITGLRVTPYPIWGDGAPIEHRQHYDYTW